MIDIKQYIIKSKKQSKYHKNVFEKVKKIKSIEADSLFLNAHEEVFNEMNCLDCANCCKTISPIFIDKDIERISKAMGLTFTQFSEKYLKIDDDQDYVLKTAPCVFLAEDNKCNIYDFRPKACREYPHTDSPKIQKLLTLTNKNIRVCPAVFEVVEKVGSRLMS